MDEYWYRYIYPKNLVLFDNEKLIAPEISKGGNFTYDKNGEFYSTTTVYGYIKKKEISDSYKSLLAILNSQLLWWYLVNTGTVLANGYFRYKPNYLFRFPIPASLSNDMQLKLEYLVDQMNLYNNKNDIYLSEQINEEINDVIFKLYNLTKEEVEIIKNT